MRKFQISLLLLLFFLILPATALAGGESRIRVGDEGQIIRHQEDESGIRGVFSLQGTVINVDLDALSFTVNDTVLFIDHTTKFHGQGMLLPGSEVRVEGVVIGDFLVAKEIHLK